MKHLLKCTTAIAFLSATSVHAGGLDRSGQSLSPIFGQEGATLSYGVVNPSITGTDGTVEYDVGGSYQQSSFSYSKKLSSDSNLTVIIDQPFGADIKYNGAGNLGGTQADLSSEAINVIYRRKTNESLSFFGGVRAEKIGASIVLNGTSFQNAIAVNGVAAVAGVDPTVLGAALVGDPASIAALGGLGNVGALGTQVSAVAGGIDANGGYKFEMSDGWGVGYSLGAAYEIPSIALRAAFTYHSEIKYTNSTVESGLEGAGASTVSFVSPQSVNIELQTGVAKDTLVTGGLRWANWEAVDVIPTRLGSDLVNLEDSYTWKLGVARRFSDVFAGSLNLTYEESGDAETVTPLGPTDGLLGVSLGGQYTFGNMNISGGINYTDVGDANAGVGDQAVATFENNSAVGVGLKVEFQF